ncbi:MAG: DUF433 domain-containing protein [Armatimonadetes bacterium]|nr:DUF433 domain-containing protein [Armatimonadota bacterium]
MFPMLSDYITKTPGVCGGKACVKGRRIRVQDVSIMSEIHGRTPDEIATAYDLTLAQVHAALAYYFENIQEIREEIRRELEFVEQFKREQAQSHSA